MSPSALLWIAGLVGVFAGERLFDQPVGARIGLDLFGAALLLASVGLRVAALRRAADPTTRRAHRRALGLAGLGIFALGLYALRLPGAVDALGLTGPAADRFGAVLSALWPVLAAASLLPLLLVDRAVSETPAAVQPRRLEGATQTGLALAFAIGLAFPVNYLAVRHRAEADLRYLKTTAAGASTLALVRGLQEPVRAVLFFAPASDVEARLEPYFDTLAGASDAFVVEHADQALDPALSKELKVSSNGTVALVRGKEVERIHVGTGLDKARTVLRKLDETVQQRLLRLTRKARVVYFTVGHEEARWTGADVEPQRKIADLKRVLESLNYRVKELGLDDGLGQDVPDDAAVVVVAGPRRPFLPEELDALRRYRDGGGRLLLLFDPSAEAPPELAALAGVRLHRGILHNERAFVRRTRTPADRALMLTNRYSSHPSVSTLTKLAGRLVLIAPDAGWLEPAPKTGLRVTETVRSMPGTWADRDGNHAFDASAGETRRVYALGTAAELKTAGGQARVAALADLGALTDAVIRNEANFQYAADTVRWLAGDDDVAGTVEREEDVRIEHTRDQDKAWFYGTIFGVPALVLVGGALRLRRRRSA